MNHADWTKVPTLAGTHARLELRDTVIFSIIDAEWQGVKRHLQHRLDAHA